MTKRPLSPEEFEKRLLYDLIHLDTTTLEQMQKAGLLTIDQLFQVLAAPGRCALHQPASSRPGRPAAPAPGLRSAYALCSPIPEKTFPTRQSVSPLPVFAKKSPPMPNPVGGKGAIPAQKMSSLLLFRNSLTSEEQLVNLWAYLWSLICKESPENRQYDFDADPQVMSCRAHAREERRLNGRPQIILIYLTWRPLTCR